MSKHIFRRKPTAPAVTNTPLNELSISDVIERLLDQQPSPRRGKQPERSPPRRSRPAPHFNQPACNPPA